MTASASIGVTLILDISGDKDNAPNEKSKCGDDLPIKCLTCGELVPRPNMLGHISAHILLGLEKCTVCNFKPSQSRPSYSTTLVDHMSVHYGLKGYACTVTTCKEAYHRKLSLLRHITRDHYNSGGFGAAPSSSSRSFLEGAVNGKTNPGSLKTRKKKDCSPVILRRQKGSCLTCGEDLIPCDLILHIRAHITKEQRQCDICHAVFIAHESLLDHIHTHYGFEPYKCAICSRTYSLKQSLLNHIRRLHKSDTPLQYFRTLIPLTLKPMKVYPRSSRTAMAQPNSYITGCDLSTSNDDPTKKSGNQARYYCNFCSLSFARKHSVQRHEAKLHDHVETDANRSYDAPCILGI